MSRGDPGMARPGDDGCVVRPSLRDGGDVGRVAEDSFGDSCGVARPGCCDEVVGDTGPSELPEDFFFLPSPKNDRLLDLAFSVAMSVLVSTVSCIVSPNLS
jgi:hypothetical protein